MMCTSCDELTMRLLNFIRSRGDAKGCQSRDVKKKRMHTQYWANDCSFSSNGGTVSYFDTCESISKGVVIGTRWLIYSESAQAITSLS